MNEHLGISYIKWIDIILQFHYCYCINDISVLPSNIGHKMNTTLVGQILDEY